MLAETLLAVHPDLFCSLARLRSGRGDPVLNAHASADAMSEG